MNIDDKYKEAGNIISKAGGTPVPVNDTLIKLLKFFIMENEVDQSMRQKMIALAQGENAPVVIALLHSCVEQRSLVTETEWQTIVNTVSMDAQATLIQNVIAKLEELRKGAFL